MASRTQRLAIGGVVVGILGAIPAQADPVRLTSGNVTLPWDDPSSFSLVGQDFLLTSLFVPAPISPQWTCFSGCSSGTLINLSALLGGDPTHHLGASYFAVVNGVRYEPHEGPALQLFGDLWFDAGDITVPAMPADGFDPVLPSTPFVLHGRIAGFVVDHWDDPLGPTPAFDVEVSGRGTATLRLLPDAESGLWRYPEVYYVLEDQTPIPEPGSLLLMSGGLAAWFARRRRTAARRPSFEHSMR